MYCPFTVHTPTMPTPGLPEIPETRVLASDLYLEYSLELAFTTHRTTNSSQAPQYSHGAQIIHDACLRAVSAVSFII